MARCQLTEIEIPRGDIDVDFSRQFSVNRLVLTGSMLHRVSFMPYLKDLVVMEFALDAVALVESFYNVSRLALSGSEVAISQVDQRKFKGLKHVAIEVRSDVDWNQRRLEGPQTRGTLFTAVYPHKALDLKVNDTWSNETLEEAVCNGVANVTRLSIEASSATTKWFRVPQCISTWNSLTYLRLAYVMHPNFDALPSSMEHLWFSWLRGTWTNDDSGSLPGNYDFDWSWLSQLPNMTSIILYQCGLLGTMPNAIVHPKLESLDLSSPFRDLPNRFTGTLNPDFFLNFPALHDLDVTNHQLTGTFPYYGLQTLKSIAATQNKFTHWPNFFINASDARMGAPYALDYIEFTDNELVQIPDAASLSMLYQLDTLRMANNRGLTGTRIPDVFVTNPARTVGLRNIYLANCGFVGTLPDIPESQFSLYAANEGPWYHAAHNQLSGPFPPSWKGLDFTWLHLNGNPGLNGTTASLSEDGTQVIEPFIKNVRYLNLDGLNITGVMPNITAWTLLTNLVVQNSPGVDFCAIPRNLPPQQVNMSAPLFQPVSPWFSTCNLVGTNVGDCMWAYPPECALSPQNLPISMPPPFSTPTPSSPSAVSPSAVSPSAVSPTTIICPPPSPGPSFICSDHGWISNISVVSPTIVIASPVTIVGNLTSANIVLTGVSSSITVSGCIVSSSNATHSVPITITLTEEDLKTIEKGGGKSLTREFIKQSDSCPPLRASSVFIKSPSNTCKRIKTNKIDTTSGLIATFSITSSKCNLWWIILISVLAGLLIVAIIIVLIVVTMSTRARHSLRPYTKRATLQRASTP